MNHIKNEFTKYQKVLFGGRYNEITNYCKCSFKYKLKTLVSSFVYTVNIACGTRRVLLFLVVN